MSLTQVLIINFLVCVSTILGLTNLEISKFYNHKYPVVLNTTANANNYVFHSSGLPDHPESQTNPNRPSDQKWALKIPKQPKMAVNKTCVPMGIMAFARNGVPYYNPCTSDFHNAVEGPTAEIFDSCNGHPDPRGMYHYHQKPVCIINGTVDELMGVALDGYPIYSANSSDFPKRLLTNADLDVCHGRTNNKTGEYRYHITTKFPYIMGCYMGTVVEGKPIVDYAPNLRDCSNTTRDGCCGCPGMGGPPRPGKGALATMSGILAAIWAFFTIFFWSEL